MRAAVCAIFDLQNAVVLWFMILHLLSNAENDDAKGHFFSFPAIKFPKSALHIWLEDEGNESSPADKGR